MSNDKTGKVVTESKNPKWDGPDKNASINQDPPPVKPPPPPPPPKKDK
jgi:hypothetical protein